MKNLRLLVLLLTVGSSILFIASCTPDPCEDITCLNGGTCDTGECDCPAGFSGINSEIQDLCFGITCEYDGTCIEGDCECTEFTTNYLIGTWQVDTDDFFVTFFDNGDWTNSDGNSAQWQISDSGTGIEVLEGGIVQEVIPVDLESITCETFVSSDGGVTEEVTLTRQ